MSISTPVQITVPFATGGLKNTIPAIANQTDGHAGYDVGFPAINMTPKVAGGIPPFGQDFNGIIFEMTTAIRYLEAGASFPYSSAFSTAVGGYPAGALVSRTDNSGLWRNTVANNTTDPEAGGAGWVPEDAGFTSVAMTNANVTLTPLQSARSIIFITGALVSNLQLIMPSYVKQWLIVNNATGAFAVTVKTAAGSGVSLSTGTTQAVYGDGTNIGAQTAQSNSIAFTTPGVTNWVVPAGLTRVWVRVIGGGGGGGKRTTVSSAGSGGGAGGGGIAEGVFTVIPGASIAVTVGAGGAGATTASTAGSSGGASSFGALISAAGGAGGGITGGGSGGVGSGGTFNSSTGPGTGGINFSNSATTDAGITGSGGGAGGAGITHNSGSGSTNGNPGIGPGGGGGGAVFSGNGGDGFKGLVELRYNN